MGWPQVYALKGGGEKEKERTTQCKSRRRRDEKAPAPWALNYGNGREEVLREGGVEKQMHLFFQQRGGGTFLVSIYIRFVYLHPFMYSSQTRAIRTAHVAPMP
jgi:hypothetical protein